MRNKDSVAFVFIGDVHARVDKPSRRLDSPIDVVFPKLRYAFERARKLDAGVVFGGDLGHRHYWDSRLLVSYRLLFQDYKDVPVFIVPGNHDIPGGSWSSYDDTGLGLLSSILDEVDVTIFTPETGTLPHRFQGFNLYAFPHASPHLKSFLEGTFSVTTDEANVAIAHAPVGDVRTPSQRDYRELYLPGFQVALFSDIHTGFKVDTVLPGCTVANPGAIYRDDLADVPRTPSIALVFQSGKVIYEAVPHLPAAEVFDLTGAIVEDKENGVVAKERSFEAALAKTRFKKDSLSPVQLVRAIGEAANYQEEVIEFTHATITRYL